MSMMKCPILALSLAMVGFTGARAQSAGDSAVAQPSSQAPAVASMPGTNTPVVVQAPSGATTPTGVTQIVYTPQLPTAAELTNAAAAQNLTVERIVQTSNQVIAFYRTANGQPMNVAYQSLPPTGTPAAGSAAPAVVVTSPAPTVVSAPPRTVIYEPAPRVVYYDYPSYYYPRVWYPPVSLSFGFGYRHFHHHGGFRHHR
jgi:hypothetical protein